MPLHLPLQKRQEILKFNNKMKTFKALVFSVNPYNTNMFSGITVFNLITKKVRNKLLIVSLM